MKKTIVQILAAGLAALTLASCNMAGNGETTTTEGSVTTEAPATTEAPSPGVDVMKFELAEYVTLGDYKSTGIEKNVYCSDEELEAQIKAYAKDKNVYTKVTDRVTEAGDMLNISYAGRVEDIYFEGGTSASATVELIENNGYIDGFADDLYGIAIGTTVETTVTFPENYHSTDLAGVSAVFEITVNYVMDYTPTDSLIKELTGGAYETLEAFREPYRSSIIKQNLENFESELYTEIVKLVVEKCEVKSYPEELVDYYYNDMLAYYTDYATSNKMELSELLAYYGMTLESLREEAKTVAKEELALHAAFLAEGLSLGEADYRMKLSELAAQYGYASGDAMESQYGEFYMKNMIRKEMCIEQLRKTLNISTDYDQYKHLLEESAVTTK